MTEHSYEHLWQDPKHWKAHFVYYCRRDPRIVVPERHRWMGWTFNFGHRSAYLLAVVMLLAAIVPSLVAAREGRFADLPLTIAFSFVFCVLLVVVVARVGRS